MNKDAAALHEELLVLRAKARDSAAFGELVHRWHARLLSHALRLTRSDDGAEEAVQEAWMAIVRGISKLNDPAAFGPWAYRITGRQCANWFHRQRRARRDRSGPLAATLRAGGQIASQRQASELDVAMDELSVDHREVLALFYVQAMSVEEIAAALDTKTGTIKSRLHYAREAVRHAMAQ